MYSPIFLFTYLLHDVLLPSLLLSATSCICAGGKKREKRRGKWTLGDRSFCGTHCLGRPPLKVTASFRASWSPQSSPTGAFNSSLRCHCPLIVLGINLFFSSLLGTAAGLVLCHQPWSPGALRTQAWNFPKGFYPECVGVNNFPFLFQRLRSDGQGKRKGTALGG